MSAALRTDVVCDAELIGDDVLAAWRALAVERNLPYCLPEWMLAFWRERHAADATLRVLVVRDGDTIAGIGPFYGPRSAGPLSPAVYWPLGAGIGQRWEPLAATGREREVAAALAVGLASLHPRPVVLRLPATDAAATWAPALAAAWPGPGARAARIDTQPGLQVRVHRAGYDAWLSDRSPTFRRMLVNRRNRVARRGARLRVVESAADAPRHLETLVRLHAERFASRGRHTGLTGPTHAAVRAAVRDLVEDGAARLWIADCDGEVVGAQLHVRAGDRMCFYNGGTSVRWDRESLGIVLLARAVEDAHALGLARVDLGAGDQHYKRRFADADEAIAWWLVRRAGAMGTLSAVRDAPASARRLARYAARALRDRRGR